ncbi:MAG: transglutaminaseTgpA domain-containing protein [Microthrixaceae bacterium]
MTVLAGAMVWASLSSLSSGPNARLSSGTIAQASGLVAVLAMFGLRSVPVRWIVRGLALVSGALLARFGQLGATEGLAGSWRVLVWVGALGLALTLAPSSRSVFVDVDAEPGADARSGDAPSVASEPNGHSGEPHSRIHGSTARAMAVVADTRGRIPLAIATASVCLVAGAALLIGPRASNWFPTGAKASDLVDQARNTSNNVLMSRESLDMTQRPQLSDKVIMSVRSPVVSFWRAELFDQWDGTTWTRSYPNRGRILDDGRLQPAADDIAATQGIETTQEFRLLGGFATVMPSAATPVEVTSASEVAQRIDGTLVSVYQALGSGTTYTVKSAQMELSAERLRSAGSTQHLERVSPVAAQVMAQYAMRPATTERVISLARRVTSAESNDFDRVMALQRWMAENNTYSLDAPLSPKGVDVVDHFLFEQREGWCEQIASSLVVLARAVGIPARLATGYAPGEWDGAGGRFVVRERDAHAWAEVWFPELGWVPFDPTSTVPLSGSEDAAVGAQARDWREVLGMVLVAVGLMSVSAGPVSGFVRRVFEAIRRRAARSRWGGEAWTANAVRRFERAGERVDRARFRSESMSRYGRSVSDSSGDQRFAEVGRLLDRKAFAPGGSDSTGDPLVSAHTTVDTAIDASDLEARVDEILAEMESR